jgi:hypothetical protein
MPVIGMNINSIQAIKKGKMDAGLKVNNTTNIDSVTEQDLTGLGKKGLKIEFTYLTAYTVKNATAAEIKITGDVIYVGEDQAEILKSWKADKKLPEGVDIVVINHILRKGITKTVALSEEL